jgi:integrator complex subunit 7
VSVRSFACSFMWDPCSLARSNQPQVLRRLLSVGHSNDPLARAITLRTVACFAMDAAERKDAHHTVLNGLRALDNTEAAAALHAADRFCETSPSFAEEAADTLVQMVRDLEISMRVKISVARIFRHAHHNLALIQRYQAASRSLLTEIPTSAVVRTLLAATTNVAARSLVGVQQQLELLVQYLETDLRLAVKLAALRGLLRLAQVAPHEWRHAHVAAVRSVLGATQHSPAVVLALRVLGALAHSPAVTLLLPDELQEASDTVNDGEHPLLSEVQSCCCADDSRVAEASCTVLCNVAIEVVGGVVASTHPAFAAAVVGQATGGVCNTVALCVARAQSGGLRSPDTPTLTGTFLRSVGALAAACQTNASAAAIAHVTQMERELQMAVVLCEPTLAVELAGCVQECTRACGHSVTKQQRLQHYLTTDEIVLDPRVRVELLATLATLLNQAPVADRAASATLITQAAGLLVVSGATWWDVLTAAQRLMCLGWHTSAASALAQLEDKVVSDHYVWWLKALRLVAEAEDRIGVDATADQGPSVRVAHSHLFEGAHRYSQAVGCLKAARHNTASCRFQMAYVQLRADTLEVLGNLLSAVKDAECSDDGQLQRHTFSTLTTELATLAAAHDTLRRSYFDIDAHSDNVLKLNRDVVLAIGHALLAAGPSVTATTLPPLLHGPNTAPPPPGRVTADSTPLRRAVDAIIEKIHLTDGPKSLDFVVQTVCDLTSTPTAVPPIFFSHATPTVVQIAVHPYPKAGQIVTIASDSELVLRVEGFVRRPPHKTPRQIGFMEVSVVLTSKAHPEPEVVSRRVTVIKKFFSTSFLLSMPTVETGELPVEVNITAAYCDTDGNEWAANTQEKFEVTLTGRSQGKRR